MWCAAAAAAAAAGTSWAGMCGAPAAAGTGLTEVLMAGTEGAELMEEY